MKNGTLILFNRLAARNLRAIEILCSDTERELGGIQLECHEKKRYNPYSASGLMRVLASRTRIRYKNGTKYNITRNMWCLPNQVVEIVIHRLFCIDVVYDNTYLSSRVNHKRNSYVCKHDKGTLKWTEHIVGGKWTLQSSYIFNN